MHLSYTVVEIWRLRDNGVMTLTFWGHVTSLVIADMVPQMLDSWWSTSYGWFIVTMRPSGTVVEIQRLKDNGVMTDLLGSRDVIGHVTIRLAVGDFLWVVHCDHASIWHRCGDMAPHR